MTKFDIGDIVTHRSRPFGKMVIIKVNNTMVGGLNNTFKCRWFNEITQSFVTDDFISQELEGVASDGR